MHVGEKVQNLCYFVATLCLLHSLFDQRKIIFHHKTLSNNVVLGVFNETQKLFSLYRVFRVIPARFTLKGHFGSVLPIDTAQCWFLTVFYIHIFILFVLYLCVYVYCASLAAFWCKKELLFCSTDFSLDT